MKFIDTAVKKKISILIPDSEWYGLTRHLKDCFSIVPDIRIYLMSNEKHIPTRYSRYVHHFSYYPKTQSETEWISNINNELDKYDIDLIVPIWESGIRTIIKHKELITQKNKLALLPDLEMFDIANNKALLAKHLKLNDIPGPSSVNLGVILPTELNDIDFPILLKPIEGRGGGLGILEFENKETFEVYRKQNQIIGDEFLIQEFIKGYDIDCSVLCKDGDIKAFTIQKGILYNSKKYAPPIGIEFLYDQQLYEVIKKLMKSLNWSGVAHIDLRYDKKEDEFKVIEVNTRFWGSTEASLVAGVNFPYLLTLLSLNKEIDTPDYRFIQFFNLDGLKWKIKKNKTFIFNFKYIWNHTAFKYIVKDPLPYLMGTIYRIINFAKRKINIK